jgi:hypothetical protein
MSDNFTTKNASGATVTLAAKELSGSVYASKQVSIATEVPVTLTRPNDTDAYAANDAITTATSTASAYTFAGCGLTNGASGTIIDATLILSDPNAVVANFELWLFVNNPAIPNDNAAFAFSDSEANDVACVIKFYSSDYSDSSNNRVYHMWNPQRMFKCDSDDTALYGVLKTLDAFTPVAQSTFRVKLRIVQDT